MPPTHCDITVGVYCDSIAPLLGTTFQVTSALGKQHFVHWKFEQNYRLMIFYSDRISFLNTFCANWHLSILLITASNMRFETRIHQLNENDSTSGLEMFSSWCSDFKVTFLLYFEWIDSISEQILQPINALKYDQNRNAKCSILQ